MNAAHHAGIPGTLEIGVDEIPIAATFDQSIEIALMKFEYPGGTGLIIITLTSKANARFVKPICANLNIFWRQFLWDQLLHSRISVPNSISMKLILHISASASRQMSNEEKEVVVG